MIGTLLVAAVAIAVVVTRSDSPSSYRVAAIFDTARGLVPGQQVKIAGTVVGRIDEVRLAPGPRARVVMSVEPRFGPFRSDASCQILPEGLLSENYVECEPGTATRGTLTSRVDGVPTVPVEHTSAPTSLQEVLNVFSLPVDQRIRVMIDELGIATAGRGTDLNALLRRSNPALGQARRVLAIVDGQRDRLAHAVAQTDRVLARLATRNRDVRAFVDRAAIVAQTTATHGASLSESVRRLPAMLDATRPGLHALDRAMARSGPLLDDVRGAAPQLTALTRTLPAFADAGTPALRSLATAARSGRWAVRAAGPVTRRLNNAAREADPFASKLDELLTNTRDRGGIEGLLRVFYSLSSAFSAYDSVSHFVGLSITPAPTCLESKKAPGCSTMYYAPGHGTIPPDDPACGPQPLATWDPPSNCSPQDASGGSRTRAGTPDRPGHTAPDRAGRPRAAASSTAAKRPRNAALPSIPLPGASDPLNSPQIRRLMDYLLGP